MATDIAFKSQETGTVNHNIPIVNQNILLYLQLLRISDPASYIITKRQR